VYFCEDDFDNFHSNPPFLKNHTKVEVSEQPKDFGKCNNHRDKDNEYFNMYTSQAYCSMCVVDGLQKVDSGSQSKNY
jgi:hypothetical protein